MLIQINNSTAEDLINKKVQPTRTKAMDMNLHWLRDREILKQFCFNCLEIWKAQLSRLPIKKPPSCTSQEHEKGIPDPSGSSGQDKTAETRA